MFVIKKNTLITYTHLLKRGADTGNYEETYQPVSGHRESQHPTALITEGSSTSQQATKQDTTTSGQYGLPA